MILASVRPELFGPLIIAGAPLAYWAGVHGKNPMRYSGGLLGGSWLTALVSDLGGGKFDGAWLVQNFEGQNPSNTLWTKQYNVYSKVDTEADRYLEFERWWGGHVNLNAEEIQFIVDELFVGNNLAAGNITLSDGRRSTCATSVRRSWCSAPRATTSLRRSRRWVGSSNATPTWMTSGPMGKRSSIPFTRASAISASSSRAASPRRSTLNFQQHRSDRCTTARPLRSDVRSQGQGNHQFRSRWGQWVMRCEARTLDDIRAMGGNSPEDERRFAAAKRVSELNLAAYRKFVQPWIKGMVAPQTAELMRNLHPLRTQYEAFSSQNPWMTAVKSAAEGLEENRKAVSNDNPFLAFQEQVSKQIVHALDSWRDSQEAMSEAIFLNVYGSPALQAAVGIDPKAEPSRGREMPAEHRAMLDKRIAELRSRIGEGGLREAASVPCFISARREEWWMNAASRRCVRLVATTAERD